MKIDELILKYLREDISLNDRFYLKKKLEEEGIGMDILDRIKLFWNDPTNKYKDEQNEVHDRIMRKIKNADQNQRGFPQSMNSSNQYVFSFRRFFTLAAAIGVFLVSYLIFTDKPEIVEQPVVVEWVHKETLSGQKLQLNLSDGSQIKLNAQSSLDFPKYFTDSVRRVHLTGEAFFEASEDPLRPFQVVVGDIVVKALGTSFGIRNRPGTTSVFLTSGKVMVTSSNRGNDVILTPGKMVTENGGLLSHVGLFDYDEIAWSDNVLVFKDATGSQVIEELEKWYGVDIRVKGDTGNWSFSGRFDNKTLKQVLLGISHAENFQFEIQNKIVLIKPD